MEKDALLDGCSEVCVEVLRKFFSTQIIGAARARSEYGEIYRTFKFLFVDARADVEFQPVEDDAWVAIMCAGVRGALEEWCKRIGRNTDMPVLIMRLIPTVDAYTDFATAVRLVKVRFRAHALTQEQYDAGGQHDQTEHQPGQPAAG